MKNISLIKTFIILCLLLSSMLIFTSCLKDGSSSKSIEEIQADGKISTIIRSPITASGIQDTVNVAKLVFEEMIYDFGEINEGDLVNHTFQFTNTGTVPLIINDAHSTCGCTVPDWPKAPIPPGASGEINVEFNSKNKPNNQEKPVIISANTYPSVTKVFIKGFVKPVDK